MPSEEYYLKRTFSLAKRAQGRTSPNPLVGAVIVKDGKIVSEGFHKKAGFPHAEVEAINKASPDKLKGATLFVNLEPCCHWGRTPPCVDKIISSGIKRVVIATEDPNPLVSGKSIIKLKRAGLEVKTGLLKEEAQRLNEVFFKNMREKSPFVVAKFAQTLDGRIADRKGKSFWITSYEARAVSKKLRGIYDAVLVGIGTVLKDNPSLDSPLKRMVKIVLDPDLKILPSFKLFRKADKVFIFTRKETEKKKKFAPNVFIEKLSYKSKEGFDLRGLLDRLYSLGVYSVFVEGGSYTLTKFFDNNLIDKLYIFVAPKLALDSKALLSLSSNELYSVDRFLRIKSIELKRIGQDFLFTGYPEYK